MNNPTEPLEFPELPLGASEHSASGTEPTLPAVSTTKTPAPTPGRTPVRVGTLVWGAVVVVIGILVLATRQAGLHLDTGQTSMWLLFGAGLAMVAGGTVNVLRRK